MTLEGDCCGCGMSAVLTALDGVSIGGSAFTCSLRADCCCRSSVVTALNGSSSFAIARRMDCHSDKTRSA